MVIMVTAKLETMELQVLVEEVRQVQIHQVQEVVEPLVRATMVGTVLILLIYEEEVVEAQEVLLQEKQEMVVTTLMEAQAYR
jgi:hypothetical protein